MASSPVRVPFLSLRPGDDRPAIDAAIARVLDRGWFILGPELQAFEAELAAASGTADAVGVNTGTDALALILRGLGIGPGDEVITTPVSAAYTALAIMATEARPVFADIDPLRLTIDPRAIEAAAALYGADRIVCGTDGTEFGVEWTSKAIADSHLSAEEKAQILYRNAAALLAPLAPIAREYRAAA